MCRDKLKAQGKPFSHEIENLKNVDAKAKFAGCPTDRKYERKFRQDSKRANENIVSFFNKGLVGQMKARFHIKQKKADSTLPQSVQFNRSTKATNPMTCTSGTSLPIADQSPTHKQRRDSGAEEAEERSASSGSDSTSSYHTDESL